MIVRQLVQLALVNAPRGRTIAGDDFFDSRMDPLAQLAKGTRRPFVIVSVEESDADGKEGPEDVGLLGRCSKLTILLQMAVASGQEIKDAGGTRIIAAIGETDAAFEATLNILDRQWRQVMSDFDNPWATIFRSLVVRIGKIIDQRSSDPETGTKHAARFIQIHVEVMPDPLPGEPIPGPIEAGLAALEADGDASYAEIARVWRALLTENQDWPEWRTLQAGLFATREDMAAIGIGPLGIDELSDFTGADVVLNGEPISVTTEP